MKCERLKPLPTRVKGLKPLTKQKFKRVKYLNQVEMICYSTNICYYTWKILNHIITPPNREQLLNSLSMEVYRMSKMLSKNDWYQVGEILTTQEHKEKFKLFGITKKSLEH